VSTTIHGVATRLNGIARALDQHGRLVGATTIKDIDLELFGHTVTIDHDPANVAGEIVYAELSDQDRLHLVAVIDRDWIRDADQDVYFSGEYDMTGRSDGLVYIATRAKVLGAALTLDPASLEASPVRWMPGDVRRQLDRGKWPVTWRSSQPVLERCVDHLGTNAERRTARHIIPRRPGDTMHRDDDVYLYDQRADTAATPESLTRRPPADWSRHGPGAPVEWSRHRGQILSVR
jgi:hypothetical protein